MVSTHTHEPSSLLGMALGVILAPVIVLGAIFLIGKAIGGN